MRTELHSRTLLIGTIALSRKTRQSLTPWTSSRRRIAHLILASIMILFIESVNDITLFRRWKIFTGLNSRFGIARRSNISLNGCYKRLSIRRTCRPTTTSFFDCPPSFSLLSYSVLSCCDLVLIPINPDFFAAKGLNLLLSTLRARIEPLPVPKIGVFMNRAKRPGGSSAKRFSNETQRYLDDAKLVLKQVANENGLEARLFDTAILDRVGMKR